MMTILMLLSVFILGIVLNVITVFLARYTQIDVKVISLLEKISGVLCDASALIIIVVISLALGYSLGLEAAAENLVVAESLGL